MHPGDHLFNWTPPDIIEPFDHPHRLWVPSDTTEDRYLVDLTDDAFPAGRCDCEDYQKRIEPKARAGELPERLTCKHIRAAREYLARIERARHPDKRKRPPLRREMGERTSQ